MENLVVMSNMISAGTFKVSRLVNVLTPWRDGSASDSRSVSCVLNSGWGQRYVYSNLIYLYSKVLVLPDSFQN